MYAFSPYKRAIGTWEIIEDYLENHNSKITDGNARENGSGGVNSNSGCAGVEIIGMREEPRVAEQQFGNFQNPHKVRTAKSERRTFGRFFFRFPNGESGLDVYSRCSSFLATLARDIKQIDQRYSYLHRHDGDCDDDISSNKRNNKFAKNKLDAMANMNILIVCHGLTLRLLLMRYFQLTVEEFENSYNSQNAKLVVMNRFVYDESDNGKYFCKYSKTHQYREYYKLDETAKEALNLLGEVSTKKPVYRRSSPGRMGDEFDCGLLLVDGDDDIEE